MLSLSDILTRIGTAAISKSPTILTALGIAGFGSTIVLAVRVTPDADRIHQRHEWHRTDISETESGEKQKELIRDDILKEAKELGLLYAPTAVMGAASIACFLGASKIQANRQAAILAAYSLSEKTLATYQEKVRERLGADGYNDIHDEVMHEIVQENQAPEGTLVVREGRYRFYDTVLGRYFYSTREEIMAAESEINRRLLAETRVPLSEFYYTMGIEDPGRASESIGWDISSRYVQSMEIMFTPMFDDEKNPCTAIHYRATVFERSL